MTEQQLLTLLKIDLGITSTAYDQRLVQYLQASEQMIAREGITLNLAIIEDCQLVVMYAAWMWRKRDSGDGMPRMLRYALNNKLFAQKVAANG